LNCSWENKLVRLLAELSAETIPGLPAEDDLGGELEVSGRNLAGGEKIC
jgi:hypothetical protein